MHDGYSGFNQKRNNNISKFSFDILKSSTEDVMMKRWPLLATANRGQGMQDTEQVMNATDTNDKRKDIFPNFTLGKRRDLDKEHIEEIIPSWNGYISICICIYDVKYLPT